MNDILLYGLLTYMALISAALIFTLNKLFSVSVEIAAFKASTHTVQYVGATNGQVNVADSVDDVKITEFNKEYREEANFAYPEFATTDEDLELRGL